MTSPLVTVVMPVYNGEKYLEEAVASILSQTYANLELIAINDGSTDASPAILASFKDPRLRIFHQENRGLSATLNRGIGLATGSYLARQDADDVSFPERVARQVEFLESHPDYCMVGTWSQILEEDRPTERGHRHPAGNAALKFSLLFDNYFVHSSVMLRKSALDRVGLYSTAQKRQPEDYELWSRLMRGGHGKMGNLPEKLVAYREVEGSICRSESRSFTDQVLAISMQNIASVSGRDLSDPVVGDLAALAHHAVDRVSERPDFKAMLALMTDAAAKFGDEGENDARSLRHEVLRRYWGIRKAYFMNRYGVFGRLLRTLVGR